MFDVISFGSATLDIFLRKIKKEEVLRETEFKEICFPLGEKNEVQEVFLQSGGGATNSATTFARSKLKTSSIFCLGDDLFGKKILKELILEEIDFSFSQIKRKILSPISVILLAPDGSRAILYHKPDPKLCPLKPPFSKIKTKWIYLSSLSGNLSLFKKILKFCFSKKIYLLANPGKKEIYFLKNNLNFLKFFDIFILNEIEFSLLTGISFQKEKEIFKKIEKFRKGIIIMTKGKKGASVFSGDFLYQVKTFPSKVLDRTGAGDAFASGFLAGIYFLQKKYPEFFEKKIYLKKPEILIEPIKFASANATSVVENLGAKTGILSYQKFKKLKRFQNLSIKIEKL